MELVGKGEGIEKMAARDGISIYTPFCIQRIGKRTFTILIRMEFLPEINAKDTGNIRLRV